MQLVITVKDGATNVDIAHALRFQAGLIEGKPAKEAAARKNTGAQAAAEEEEEETGFGSEVQGADEGESFDDVTTDEEEEKPTKKAAGKTNGKAKKISLDDVNDVCKAHAAENGREETLKILMKKFKTKSVSTLKPEQYPAVIAAMSL